MIANQQLWVSKFHHLPDLSMTQNDTIGYLHYTRMTSPPFAAASRAVAYSLHAISVDSFLIYEISGESQAIATSDDSVHRWMGMGNPLFLAASLILLSCYDNSLLPIRVVILFYLLTVIRMCCWGTGFERNNGQNIKANLCTENDSPFPINL